MRFFSLSKTVLVFLMCLLAIIFARQLRIADPDFLQSVRSLTFDTYQRIRPRAASDFPIRIVDIDQRSLREFGQWPWPRTEIAKLTDALREAGAAVVAFDIVFGEPDRTAPNALLERLQLTDATTAKTLEPLLQRLPDNDRVLAEAFARTPTVLAFFAQGETPASGFPPKANSAIAGDDPTEILPPVETVDASLPLLVDQAIGHGVANIFLNERSDVIRQYQLFYADPDGPVTQNIYPAFGLEALRAALQAPNYVLKNTKGGGEVSANTFAMTAARVGGFEIPLTADGALYLYFSRDLPERRISAADLLAGPTEKLKALVEGHIVFVGTSAAGLRDLRTNALGETVPGVSIHAEAVDQILSQTFLKRPDWATGLEIAIMIIIGLMILMVLPYAGALVSAIFGLVSTAAVILGSWYAFTVHGLLIDPVFPMLTGASIYLLATILLFAVTEKEKRFVRTAFQRYLAPNLLQKLEQSPESLKLGGEIRDMTLMFMDIRGFTPISEKLSPEELVAFLNRLLSPLSDVIQRHEGAIDKYIGDSIMAFWNAPLDVEEHPQKAVRAGLAMLEEVRKLNAADAFGFHKPELGLGDVEIGIGLNTGEGCVGNMGSDNRFDYSVIGDTVNVASRIESSCKAVGWPLLISGSTAEACQKFAVLEAGKIPLKGKSELQTLYAVIGDETYAATPEFKALKAAHSDLMKKISGRKSAKEIEKAKEYLLALADFEFTHFVENLDQAILSGGSKKGARAD